MTKQSSKAHVEDFRPSTSDDPKLGPGPKGEPPRYTGEDFTLARNGRIAALYVYLDSPPV